MKQAMRVAGMLFLAGVIAAARSKPAVQWAEPMDLESEIGKRQRIQVADGSYAVIDDAPDSSFSGQITARLFDRQGRELKASTLRFAGQSKPRLIALGHRQYFLTEEVEQNPPRIHLHSWAFDPAALTVAKAPVTIASASSDGPPPRGFSDAFVQRRNVSNRPDFTSVHWTTSTELDRFYVLETSGTGESRAATLRVKTYDPELRLLSERHFPLASTMELLKVNQFSAQYGHLVVSAREYEKPPMPNQKMPGFKLQYFILPDGEDALRSVAIELPGLLAYEARYFFEGLDDFVSYGLYSTSTEALSAGAFFARYHIKDRRLGSPQLRAFPAPIARLAGHGDKRFKRNDSEVSNFRVIDVHSRPDGGLQFIAEQRWSQTIAWVEEDVSMTFGRYDDVMVYTLYDDPAADWYSLIRKRQSTTATDQDFSFSHTYDKGGTVWMFFNDLPQNLALPESKEPANLKDGRNKMGTVLAKINPRGRVSKELLFTRKDIGHVFAPQQTRYLPDGTVLLTAFEKRSSRVGTLSLSQ